MASDLDSSGRGASAPEAPASAERASSPSSSGVREALRSFARDGARVVVLTGETNRQRFVVHPGAPAQRFRIGASAACNWTVEAPGVAPLHLELHWDGGELFVTPLGGSTVLLNGATHRHRVRITGDTRMLLGEAELALWVGAEPRPEEHASPSRPPQAFHVARPPRLIDDASRTRTAMGMVSPLLAAWQAKQAADAAARSPSDAARPVRRTEPFYVGGLSAAEDARPAAELGAAHASVVLGVAGGASSLFDSERVEPWPEPPLAEHERDGAHMLVPAEESAPERSGARATPVPPWEDPNELAGQHAREPAPPPVPDLSPQAWAPALPLPEDTRGITVPAMRVLTSELTVVDPGARASSPVPTPRPAPQLPSTKPPLAVAPEPWASHLPASAIATQSMPMDTAWPLPPASLPPPPPAAPAPAIVTAHQARWLDPLPAPQPERPLLATSAALRDRYLRDREAEWETPSSAALERPRVSVLGQPRAAHGGAHSRLYWLGIVLALLGMSAAPLAIPELREDARELLRRGLRTVSALVGHDTGLDRALPPRPPRAPEITERVR